MAAAHPKRSLLQNPEDAGAALGPEDRGRVYRTIDADRTASAAVASEPCGPRSLDAAFMTGAGLVIDGGITAQ